MTDNVLCGKSELDLSDLQAAHEPFMHTDRADNKMHARENISAHTQPHKQTQLIHPSLSGRVRGGMLIVQTPPGPGGCDPPPGEEDRRIRQTVPIHGRGPPLGAIRVCV